MKTKKSLKSKTPRPRLSSHWEGYCVVRGPPSELKHKWYQMVYYAMCAGQTECCLMKMSLGDEHVDVHVGRMRISNGQPVLELKDSLKRVIEDWCAYHEISYYLKRPTDSSGYVPNAYGQEYINSDFVYLMACWETPRNYKYEHPNPFEDSSNE